MKLTDQQIDKISIIIILYRDTIDQEDLDFLLDMVKDNEKYLTRNDILCIRLNIYKSIEYKKDRVEKDPIQQINKLSEIVIRYRAVIDQEDLDFLRNTIKEGEKS